jgi:hypothetical protein
VFRTCAAQRKHFRFDVPLQQTVRPLPLAPKGARDGPRSSRPRGSGGGRSTSRSRGAGAQARSPACDSRATRHSAVAVGGTVSLPPTSIRSAADSPLRREPMPNADFHCRIAVLSGSAVALTLAPRDPRAALFEVLGGLLGGSAPDVFDPPTRARHRSVGHGVFTSGAALFWCVRRLPRAQAALRQPRSSPRALAGGAHCRPSRRERAVRPRRPLPRWRRRRLRRGLCLPPRARRDDARGAASVRVAQQRGGAHGAIEL